ncbi:uncharacterized protein [Palaemon carinicauda]|uniref:uncharacterized protein n=1 Tax=Palaemon carinicauda TaxID=392227 RepID=UPI0035B5F41C
MSSSDLDTDDFLSIAVALEEKKRKKRSKWSKSWLLKRNDFSHTNLLEELRLKEPQDWFNYLRMDEDTFLELLSMVTPIIEKKDTKLREAISPHQRLAATLRFLATGKSYEDLKFSTCISPQALGHIIPETSDAIYRVLKPHYLKFPSSVAEWKAIAQQFENKWQFPNCCGALDGKHISITPPHDSGSYYWNYKGFNSVVLLALANANYEFIMCDVGTNGRISDGGVLENTKFGDLLSEGKLNLPEPAKPENSSRILPYVFIGDEAFALRKHFLKPYSSKDLTKERRLFNYRLSRGRRIIENVFGIMTSRFRIFSSPINLKIANIEKVVLACCVLHNFLRRKCSASYLPPENVSNDIGLGIENLTIPDVMLGDVALQPLERTHTRNPPQEAKEVRNQFMAYFMEEGAVPWQDKSVGN